MKVLLLLVHRIPYPPNKGDKIRSFHLLKMLSKHYRVFLGAFVDDPQDWVYADAVKAMCADAKLLPLSAKMSKLKSLMAFMTGDPMTLPYYYRGEMQDWVDTVLANESVNDVIIFSSAMAQYVQGAGRSELRRIMDFVDVDSEKWRAFSVDTPVLFKWIYARESSRLLECERRIAKEFDSCWFVSPEEMRLFQSLVPDFASKIDYYRNGVDLDYFNPARTYLNPYPADVKPVVFTGAMDYRPNVEAALYFAREVFPLIRREVPIAQFYVVGSNPPDSLKALDGKDAVTVTGRVPDIRPYLAHADCAVAPLKIARGVQNKVLEAMAMGRPVVASPEALTGIDAMVGQEILVGSNTSELISAVVNVLNGSASVQIGENARRRIESTYSWETSLKRLVDHLSMIGSHVSPCDETCGCHGQCPSV